MTLTNWQIDGHRRTIRERERDRERVREKKRWLGSNMSKYRDKKIYRMRHINR